MTANEYIKELKELYNLAKEHGDTKQAIELLNLLRAVEGK